MVVSATGQPLRAEENRSLRNVCFFSSFAVSQTVISLPLLCVCRYLLLSTFLIFILVLHHLFFPLTNLSTKCQTFFFFSYHPSFSLLYRPSLVCHSSVVLVICFLQCGNNILCHWGSKRRKPLYKITVITVYQRLISYMMD